MKFSTIKNIVLVILIALFFYQLKGGKINIGKTTVVDGKRYEIIKEIHDTTEVTKTNTKWKKGEDIYHTTIVHDTTIKLVNVDTAALLYDYFAKNIYNDTLHLPDSLGYVFLTDTITKNKIEGRKFIAKVKEKVITNTTIVKELPKTKFFYGLDGGFNKADLISHLGMGLLINTKSDKIYHLGVGVANRTGADATTGKLSPYIGGGVYWKIRLKK
jgi:hypothetical protein